MENELKWIKVKEFPFIQEPAFCVAFSNTSKSLVQVIERPSGGWSKIVGWDDYCVLPEYLWWTANIKR